MKVKCLGTDRSMVLRVMETELKKPAVYLPSPEFAYTVGCLKLRRDGYIEVDDGSIETNRCPEVDNRDIDAGNKDICVLSVLASLGLCEYSYTSLLPDNEEIAYSTMGHSGISLMNILSMLSARQRLLNQAIDARSAFYVAETLMIDLLAHPPETIYGVLQALYRRDREYHGVTFSHDYICFTGFRKGHPEEAHIHHQLADLIIATALSRRWIKPFTSNVRNRKYAFRTWINSIGMTGPEYEEARTVLLGRLYGRSDQRIMPRGKERG